MNFILKKSIFFAILTTLVMVGAASYFVFQHIIRADQERHQLAINRTLSELLLPSLNISDYGEIKRILNNVSKESQVYAVITKNGDLIVHDDTLSSTVSSYFSTSKTNCNPSIIVNGTRIYCSKLEQDTFGSGGRIPRGYLIMISRMQPLQLDPVIIFTFAGFSIFSLLLVTFLLTSEVSRKIILPVRQLERSIADASRKPLESKFSKIQNLPPELNELQTAFEQLIQGIRHETKQKNELSKKAALAQLASHVSHDIRSPLAALNMATKDLVHLPENTRILVRSAVSRINDIANNLLGEARNIREKSAPTSQKQRVLVPTLIDGVVSEKRLQYRSQMSLEIETILGPSSYGLFIEIETEEIKRILSNLIDNSFQATNNNAKISVGAFCVGPQIKITVQDNGRGIPKNLINELGQEGFSVGKKSGTGLGLFHAINTLKKFGGDLSIDSQLGEGTLVAVSLPRSQPPSWFLSELILDLQNPLIIVDDNESIHHVWNGRIAKAGITNLTVLHFSKHDELANWLSNTPHAAHARFLVDYEFQGHHNSTGLKIIQDLKIVARSILVTSHFEDTHIQQECTRLGIPLIPKPMAEFIPLRVS